MTHPTASSPRRLAQFAADCRGIAAVEFAMALPIMLVLLFGVIEITAGVTAHGKLTMATRTLSDLISRDDTASDALLKTVFAVSGQVMAPHAPQPLTATISEIKIIKNPDNSVTAAVHWSKALSFDGAGTATLSASALNAGDAVTVPAALKVAAQYPVYLIRSNASYTYVPTIGYVVAKAGITMTDETYTKPRQTNTRDCVLYGAATC
jgi:Flp pilus assembly protein TadG